MTSAPRNQYLESKVLSAPAHRLHLMLIEAAIRRGRQAEEALRRADLTGADKPMMQTIEIVGELLAGVREQKTDLNKQIAGVYWFIFRLVSEAKINDNADKMKEALKLLEFERETWQLVCDKIASQDSAGAPQESRGKGSAPRKMPVMPHLDDHSGSVANSSFSLEA
jgi:flagellar secretion chaperone FliS